MGLVSLISAVGPLSEQWAFPQQSGWNWNKGLPPMNERKVTFSPAKAHAVANAYFAKQAANAKSQYPGGEYGNSAMRFAVLAGKYEGMIRAMVISVPGASEFIERFEGIEVSD